MPKTWLYFIALGMLLVGRALLLNVGFVEWLWYSGHEQLYYTLGSLRVNKSFLNYWGGWPLPVFIITVFAYWYIEYDEETISRQFLLLPLAYAPFSVFGTMLTRLEFDASLFSIHPLVVIPIGYLYILPWALAARMFEKFRLVM